MKASLVSFKIISLFVMTPQSCIYSGYLIFYLVIEAMQQHISSTFLVCCCVWDEFLLLDEG